MRLMVCTQASGVLAAIPQYELKVAGPFELTRIADWTVMTRHDPKGGAGMQPRDRMLFAAERLFAEHGIEAVSLRQIASVAGHGNTNAVKYHFASKAGLVQAIFMHRVREMEDTRRSLLAKAQQDGMQNDALTLLKIMALPHLDIVDEQGRHPFAHFLAQYLIRYQGPPMEDPEVQPAFEAAALRQLLDLLENRIFYVPRKLVRPRISLCLQMFIGMIVNSDNDPSIDCRGAQFHELINDTLEMMVAAFTTPFRHCAESDCD